MSLAPRLTEIHRPAEEVLTRVGSLKGQKGKIAVIEPASGEYFLGRTLTEALKLARQSYPGKVFYSIRIGYPYVHEHKGGLRAQ